MTGMYFHSGSLLGTAYNARDRAIEAVAKTPSADTQDALVAIIMSVVSTEAFINELAESLPDSGHRVATDHGDLRITPEMVALSAELKRIEAERGSLIKKYLAASQKLTGKAFSKGSNPFQDFIALVNLRNVSVHG